MKIKIGGVNYKIEFIEADNINDDLGEVRFNKSVIRINKETDKQQQLLAFIHELLHCINNQLSEKDVEFLAMAIYQIIKDNKKILKEIFIDN